MTSSIMNVGQKFIQPKTHKSDKLRLIKNPYFTLSWAFTRDPIGCYMTADLYEAGGNKLYATYCNLRSMEDVQRRFGSGRFAMGCAPSEPRDNNLHQHFANPPPLSVRIGNGVRHGDGGPGSQKGLVIEELTQRFDFTSITVEEIIFNCLPDKDDSGTLSVEWIFSMISDKLDASKHQRFVVDIVPSVTSISRADSFFDSNHERCLEEFEKQNPVMFALVLEVSEDVALQERNGNAVKEKKNDINKTTNENNQFDKDIDKGDRGKLEKRIHLYSLCSQPFIDYFKQTQRVISVTVPGSATNVASTVSTILIDHGFIEQQQPGRVVLFGVG
ncbi:hypothetical protein DICVIV_06850 [Dictyocaulus viviparus]|uniref:Uncharacterized protein n=1 Tax=Dictyocaulus viviparus TaxID=29172 RepID=A0A0D8XRE4_DICVI|nr:hypothetical protein DICVIV_06850 [Dictyocaulus viviparus]